MTDYIVPCDTVARLSKIMRIKSAEHTPWFDTIRIENGYAVASNRIIMAVENIGGVGGPVHVKIDEALIAQCEKEAAYGGKLLVVVNEQLQFATAKTTFGYMYSGNCVLWSDAAPNDFDRWRAVVDRTRTLCEKSTGGMLWDANNIANLAASSPSGAIVFEENIDATGMRPTIVRDIHDHDWFGVFQPFSATDRYNAATLPSWMLPA